VWVLPCGATCSEQPRKNARDIVFIDESIPWARAVDARLWQVATTSANRHEDQLSARIMDGFEGNEGDTHRRDPTVQRRAGPCLAASRPATALTLYRSAVGNRHQRPRNLKDPWGARTRKTALGPIGSLSDIVSHAADARLLLRIELRDLAT